MGTMRIPYNKSLDGLRAVAVVIVLVAHAGVRFPASGGMGVEIFFVLSGFLITSILSAEYVSDGGISFRSFYIRRLLRLAPCLVLTVAAYAFWALWVKGRAPWSESVIALTYTSNWARGLFNTELHGLGHTWSLAIEEQFYLLWPISILGLERVAKTLAVKAWILFALALSLALYRCGQLGYLSTVQIYFRLDTHLDGLVLGGALCYGLRALAKAGGIPVFGRRLLSCVVVPTAILSLGLMMRMVPWRDPFFARWGFLMAALATAAIIADLSVDDRSWLRPLLTLKPVAYIGRISYGLYLWHYPIYKMNSSAWGARMGGAWVVALDLLMASAVAALSFHLLESRFLALKSRFAAGNSGT